MLSPHTLLVAAIFVPYFGLMVVLSAYIWHTGRHPDRDDADEPERARA